MRDNEVALREAISGVLSDDCSLEDLSQLAQWVLGPNRDGSLGDNVGSASANLLRACEERGALSALIDSLSVLGKSLPTAITKSRLGWDDFLGIHEGEELGDFLLLRQLGEDALGRWYAGRYAGDEVIVRVVRRSLSSNTQSVTRFLAASRSGGSVAGGFLAEVQAAEHRGNLMVAYTQLPGETLKAKVNGRLPLSYAETVPVLQALLAALTVFHEKGMAFGAVQLESIWVEGELDNPTLQLTDFGTHHLTVVGGSQLPAGASAPEVLSGAAVTPRADLYAVGALLFELLSGRKPVMVEQAVEAVAHHVLTPASELQRVAAAGWVTPELSHLVSRLLSKDPHARPRNAGELLELLPRGVTAQRIDDAEFTARYQAAYVEFANPQVLDVLARSIDDGVDPARVAASFSSIAQQLDIHTQPEHYAAWRELQLKAAGVYEASAARPADAVTIYRALLEADGGDDLAGRGLERGLRKLGRYEELVEWLLEEQQAETSRFVRAKRMSEIGQLYEGELNDREQAMVAYVEAFEECPQEDSYRQRIEQLAGSDVQVWEKVLVDCTDDISRERETDDQVAFYRQVADWYLKRLGRGDLALPWYQQALSLSPHDVVSLQGLCDVFRKSGHWAELVHSLVARADLPATTRAIAARLRIEAAEVALEKLNDAATARGLCERALLDDPQQDKASQILAATFERSQDARGFASLLERQAQTLAGADRAKLLSRAGDAHHDKLSDPANAERLYLEALQYDAADAAALRGLDRLYGEQGRVGDLLRVLQQQLAAAETPRQRIALWDRQIAIYEGELKDLDQAALGCLHILSMDPRHASARQRLHRFYRALGRDTELAASYEEQLQGDLPNAEQLTVLMALGDLAATKLADLPRAASCYERAAVLDEQSSEPLQKLYEVQRKLADSEGALLTLERLADREPAPGKQAERHLAAAEILMQRGDSQGAVERCKLALDVDPSCRPARDRLLTIYGERGDHGAMATLLEQQVDFGAGNHERAAVLGQLARVTWTHLRDEARAFAAATQAVELDATNRDARLVLAEQCHDDSRFAEAVMHYDHVIAQLDTLSEPEAVRTLANYLESLTQSGAKDKSVEVARKVLSWPATNLVLLRRAAAVLFDAGTPDEAAQAYRRVLSRGEDSLTASEKVEALCRLGLSEQRRGHAAQAQTSFEEALEIDANSLVALDGLAQAHQDAGVWDKAVEVLYRQIDLKSGEEQTTLLLKIGDLAAQQLKDTDYAARAYLLAFEGLPEEAAQRRTVLAKLMQLYSAERDWGRLLAVIQRLADYVDDKGQKAKYLFTAAKVALNELADPAQAAALFDRVLDYDPLHEQSLQSSLNLRRQLKDPQALKELLKKEVNAASLKQDQPRALRALDELAQIYARDLGQMDKAISTLQAAVGLDPDNRQRRETLAKCYFDQRARYPSEALAAYYELLDEQPLTTSVHRALRQLHTDSRNADGAWCACQTLTVLGQATQDERSFYERRREPQMFAAGVTLSPVDALEVFLHPGADGDFTRLAALIQPSLQRVRGQTLEQLGYHPEHLLQREERFPLFSAAGYISQVVGLPPPPILRNQQFEGNLSILPSNPLCFALGAAGLIQDYPMQAAAFIAGHEVCFLLPGMGVVQLVANHTMLKTWMLGALRIVSPSLGAGSILPAPLNEASEALHHDLIGARRDALVTIATKMTKGDPVDLKRWLASVELTADRMGFFFCNDLQIALEMIKGNHSASQYVSVEHRSQELVKYAVSEAYLSARARLAGVRTYSQPPLSTSVLGAPG
jgi:tetratricopeptide (TPR) repeat protein